MEEAFSRIAHWTSVQVGRPHSFIVALTIIVSWGASGFAFGFSDVWQLVINTGTTIVTFLMLFLLQNTQARDTAAIQLKLDELIAATEKASNRIIGAEDLTEDQLRDLKRKLSVQNNLSLKGVRYGLADARLLDAGN